MPCTFLNKRTWESEIITDSKQGFQDKIETISKEEYQNGGF